MVAVAPEAALTNSECGTCRLPQVAPSARFGKRRMVHPGALCHLERNRPTPAPVRHTVEPYRFSGDLDYDVSSGELRRDGVVTRLEPQPAAVLALLASRAGAVVTHDEIAQAVWREGTHVNYREGVHYCVRQVRLALADNARAPRFIETIPRRGYRFRSDALRPAEDAEPAAIPGPVASAHVLRPAWRRFRLVVACAAALIVAATLVIERRPNNHHEIALSLLRTLHDVLY